MVGARHRLKDAATDRFALAGARAVIATMHGKEQVIAPLLADALGLVCDLAQGLDTDAFGTFSRERERTGTALDAARAKAEAALALVPGARVALASEGSFGPHPHIPFAPMGHELVLLVDRETGLELAGHDTTLDVRYAHVIARTLDEAQGFASRIGFPQHALIVMGCAGGQPAPHLVMRKGITTPAALAEAVSMAISESGEACVETDMRAHHNPTRMAAIARATQDLARRYTSRCPACAYPGFAVTERIAGLPCAWCGTPTALPVAEVRGCVACEHREQRPALGPTHADPGLCPRCNP